VAAGAEDQARSGSKVAKCCGHARRILPTFIKAGTSKVCTTAGKACSPTSARRASYATKDCRIRRDRNNTTGNADAGAEAETEGFRSAGQAERSCNSNSFRATDSTATPFNFGITKIDYSDRSDCYAA
jgi:hypothetical protein